MLLAVAAATAMSCRSPGEDNDTPDARVTSTADAMVSSPDASIAKTIKSINMGTEPKFRDPIQLDNVVVVARVTSSSQGNVWVQDMGGGEYSGLHIFCSFTSMSSPCVHKTDFIDGLAIGDVVSISGVFSNNDFNGRPDDWEVIQPVITKKGTKVTPVALTVPAADVAKAMVGMDPYKNKYNGSYVKVMGPVSIAKFQAPEYKATCTPSGLDGGLPMGDYFDAGFEAKVGDTTLMVGTALFDTLKSCLPDCGFCQAPDLIKETDTFGFVQGIAYADRRNNLDFVEIRPSVDADLPRN